MDISRYFKRKRPDIVTKDETEFAENVLKCNKEAK